MPPTRVQACPPPSRTPPNRLKADGGAWLVGLSLLLAPSAVAAKPEAPFHLRFEGAAIGLKVTFDVDQGTARVSRGGRTIGSARFKKPKGATTPAWVDPWTAAIPGAVIVGASANIGDGCGAWIYGDVRRILVPAGR